MKYFLFIIGLVFFTAHAKAEWDCSYYTSTVNKYSFELEREAKDGYLSLCVDSKRYYGYELENIAQAGGHIKVYAEKVNYYSFEIESIANKGPLTYVVGNKSIYGYELENIAKKGGWVELKASRTNFYSYEFESIAKARKYKNRGGLVLILDIKRFYDYELENFRKAGARIIRPRDNK